MMVLMSCHRDGSWSSCCVKVAMVDAGVVVRGVGQVSALMGMCGSSVVLMEVRKVGLVRR